MLLPSTCILLFSIICVSCVLVSISGFPRSLRYDRLSWLCTLWMAGGGKNLGREHKRTMAGASGASSFGCPTDYSCCNQVTAFTNIHRMWRLKLPHNVDNKLSTRPSVASVSCSLHCWTDDRTARSHTAKVTAPMCPSFALQGAGHYHHHHDLWRLAAAAAQGPHAVQLGMGREHNVLSSLDRWLLKLTNQQFNVSFGSTAFLWHISVWIVGAKLGTSLNPGGIAPSPP